MNRSEARAHPTTPPGPHEAPAPTRAVRRVDGPLCATLALALACVGCSQEPPAKDQVAEEKLRAELTPLVRDQLRNELRPVVMDELRKELTNPDTPPTTGPSEPATAPAPTRPDTRPTGPGTAPPSNPSDPQGDLWNRPGTTIWPSPGGLRLVELSVGTGLEEKLPVGIASHYQEVPEILFCYTVFENPGPDQTVTHVWRRSGRLVSRVELEVGKSPKWRTWSKQRTAPHWRGVWSCEVLSPDGTQLGLHVFQVGG